MSRRNASPPRSNRFSSSASDEQRQNQERLKQLTNELSKLKGENSQLQADLTHERRNSPARSRPMTPMPAGDDESILNYIPSSEERNPVDRLLTEVQQKSALVRKVEEAKKARAAPGYINKLESLLKKLDTLHASLAQRVDGRLIAHIRANSPPRTRESSRMGSALGSPREASTSLETAQQMREMLQRRHNRMAAVQGSAGQGVHLSPSPSAPNGPTEAASYESTAAAASRMADRMATRPSTSTATQLIGALEPTQAASAAPTSRFDITPAAPPSNLNSRVDAALAAGHAATSAARNVRTSPSGSPRHLHDAKDPVATSAGQVSQGDYLQQRKYDRKQESSPSPPRVLQGYTRDEPGTDDLQKKLEAQRAQQELEISSLGGGGDRNRRKSISEQMGSGRSLANNLAAQREEHERAMAAILK